MLFIDLNAQQIRIKEKIDANIQKVLSHGQYILGPEVAELEERLAEFVGAKHCISVANGTDALQIVQMAFGIGPGDEVIIPVYTFVATYNVVVLNYALPVLIDTDIETFQIDANKVQSAVTPQTRAIMPVHIGGSPFDIDAFVALGEKNKLPIIEDACQAHLAEWKGKKVGNYGLAGAFSFQASKNLNCAEGGAITSNDEAFIKNCYTFHNQGQGGRSVSYGTGSGSRASIRSASARASLMPTMRGWRASRATVAGSRSQAVRAGTL